MPQGYLPMNMGILVEVGGGYSNVIADNSSFVWLSPTVMSVHSSDLIRGFMLLYMSVTLTFMVRGGSGLEQNCIR